MASFPGACCGLLSESPSLARVKKHPKRRQYIFLSSSLPPLAGIESFPALPPGLWQPVGVHPCCHVHQSWAKCQSDRLTSQRATARLRNRRYNGALSATSSPGIEELRGRAGLCWDQAAGIHEVPWETHEDLAHPAAGDTHAQSSLLSPGPKDIPRIFLGQTAAHPTRLHILLMVSGMKQSQTPRDHYPRSLTFLSACSSHCVSVL